MNRFLLFLSTVSSAVSAVQVKAAVREHHHSINSENAIQQWFESKIEQSSSSAFISEPARELLAFSISYAVPPSNTFQSDFEHAFAKFMQTLLEKYSDSIYQQKQGGWPAFVKTKLEPLVSAMQVGVLEQDQRMDGIEGYDRVFWEKEDEHALFKYAMRMPQTMNVVRDYVDDDHYSAAPLQKYIRENFVMPSSKVIENETRQLIQALPRTFAQASGKLELEKYFRKQLQSRTLSDAQKKIISKVYDEVVGKAFVRKIAAAPSPTPMIKSGRIADPAGSGSDTDNAEDTMDVILPEATKMSEQRQRGLSPSETIIASEYSPDDIDTF